MSFWKVWTNSDHLKQNSQFWNSEENHLIICLCHLCKQTSNETRFVVWPQERIIFQCAKSGIFSSGILMVSLAIWNGNLYPNIWYLALEFLVSNDPNGKRSNRRIPNTLATVSNNYFLILFNQFYELWVFPAYLGIFYKWMRSRDPLDPHWNNNFGLRERVLSSSKSGDFHRQHCDSC